MFTGDTIFNGGCGFFMEGTPEEMAKNVQIVSGYPNANMYGGHEYT